MLRASGQMAGQAVDLAAVTETAAGDAGVEHGGRLLAFTDAASGEDDALLDRERRALCAVLPAEAFVDACALVAAFNVVDRIADATGIPPTRSARGPAPPARPRSPREASDRRRIRRVRGERHAP